MRCVAEPKSADTSDKQHHQRAIQQPDIHNVFTPKTDVFTAEIVKN